jgi:hypothetical protein
MRKVLGLAALALIVASAPAVRAQSCTDPATVGNFSVDFQGVTFDGTNSKFDYCITGLDVPDFRALSNWLLSLDLDCITADDLVSCGPEPCFYQVDDPNLGLTGIKFDDLEVEKGETECFNFVLKGNWTNLIGEVSIGLKAATTTSIANICGPLCSACSANLSVAANASGNPSYSLELHHMRPSTVTATITYQVLNSAGRKVRSWNDGSVTMAQGDVYTKSKVIPGAALAPGTYKLRMQMLGMSSWVNRVTTFTIP